MKKSTWMKQHRWFGQACAFFILLFVVSGIVLNHRSAVAGWEVSRRWLPERYAYRDWNGGLLRGTLRHDGRVVVYGANGLWLTDSVAGNWADFNRGLPQAADYRQIRQVVAARGERLYAVTPFALYVYDEGRSRWREVPLSLPEGERLTDLSARGDTLVAVGRSHLYVSDASGQAFTPVTLPAAADYDGRVSLFRTVWLLHSGDLFGTVGRVAVDVVGLVLAVLCVTGLLYWLLPVYIRRRRSNGKHAGHTPQLLRSSLRWHDKVGRVTIVFTLLLALTGWMLRPPLLIPLALTHTKPVPGSSLDSPNAWNDRLRMLRYDHKAGDWLLSTSEGFYSMAGLRNAVPQKLPHTPPVSVMGLNVLQPDRAGRWLCGSFSGMYVWDRMAGRSFDYFTHEPAPEKAGPPLGQFAVSGYSDDLASGPFVVEYYEGTAALPQPDFLRYLPMSLWNVALELHSGRLYIGAVATYVFIFLAGLAVIWCLWSGWKVRRR